MVMVAGSGVEENSSVALHGESGSAHSVLAPGVTVATLRMSTATGLGWMVAVMVNVTVPPLGATVIGTSVGDPVPVRGFSGGDPQVDPVLGVQVQVAVASSSSGGSGSEKLP